MSTLSDLLKKPLLHGVLIGAFGGMAPKIIDMIPKLFNNIFPSAGHLLALSLLALIGGVAVVIYKETDLKKAFVIGAGAPAILATLTAQAVAPTQTTGFLPLQFSVVETAYAQTADETGTIRFVITQNESPYALNKLWIRADGVTIGKYMTKNDTIIVPYPRGTKEIQISLPEQGFQYTVPGADLQSSVPILLRIVNDQQTKDFWETFGNKSIPKYKIEKGQY
jgi:hypothetical protein